VVVRAVVAFVSGLVFAIGLGVGQLTRPQRVVAFLDVAGNWDPQLALVMAGAVVTTLVCFPRILARHAAWTGEGFALPSRRDVDGPLVGGAALFGVGWGLGGYCPGPAVVSLATGAPPVLVFVGAMLAGLFVGGWVERVRTEQRQERAEAVRALPTSLP
jgi:uncharacterized membrane protein YedE/YeeE